MKKLLVIASVVLLIVLGGSVAWRNSRPPAVGDRAGGRPQTARSASARDGAAGVAAPDRRTDGPSSPSPASGPSSTEPRPPVRWLNIAAAALGGRVEHVSSVDDRVTAVKSGWSAASLIDAGVADPVCVPLCGWSSKDDTVPQEIVLSFYQKREAVISRVVLDTLTSLTRTLEHRLPKQVEISVSRSSPSDGFTPIATVELPPQSGQHAIDFPPTAARYLRVKILSAYRGDTILLGEISVFETERREPSILQDFPRNLALFALGGAIVAYTSEYAMFGAYRLIDGDPAQEWRSGGSLYFPQEFVFAFHDDTTALVDRIVFDTDAPTLTGAKVVSVSTSTTSPVDGFEEVGRFRLTDAAGPQAFPIRRLAKFVKVRILENHGSKLYASLGEVQLIEGTEPGYESILFRSGPAAERIDDGRRAGGIDGKDDDLAEREKNDQPGQANALELGLGMRARIEPIGEDDYFKFSLPGPDRSVITVDLAGEPNIRTSLTLVNPAGSVVKQFDPARVPAERTAFSWLLDPGEYTLRATQPLASVIVIWDTSGSMERSVTDLQRAVEGYLDQVTPAERVNLIRFSYDIEVLLPDLTSDREALKKAAAGKFFADGHTPFYDVIAKAAGLLEGIQGNRAIIVMTDGADAGSHATRAQFWDLLQDKGIRLYTIGLGEIDRYTTQLGSSAKRLLTHAAMATNGRAYFSRSSADLPRFYREISEELRRTCTYRIHATRARASGTLDVRITGERITSVAAPSQIELILDASGSMKRAVGGRRMIDTAKAVLTEIVRQLPEDMHVALRVYGHRIREGRPGACEDSELVFPFARLNKDGVLAKIQRVQALGTTPIAYSLQQVARDVGNTPGEKMIVLVTDGKEECGGNPSAAIAELAARGLKVKLNIVGFALADSALKTELRRLAAQTKGQFFDAKDAPSLRAAIEQSLAVPYEVLDASDVRIAEGISGGPAIVLPEGVYTVRFESEKPTAVPRVRVAASRTTTVHLKKDGQELGVHVAAPDVR